MVGLQEGQVSLVLGGDMMARVLIILGGMLLGALAAYGLFWIAGTTFGPLYASEEDMSRNIKLFMITASIGIATGGWIGHRIFKRYWKP